MVTDRQGAPGGAGSASWVRCGRGAGRWSSTCRPASSPGASGRSGKALRRASDDEPAHKLIEAARLMRLEDEPPAPYLFAGDEAEAKRAAALTAGDGADPGRRARRRVGQGKAWPVERFAEVARRLLSPGGPMAGGRLMLLGDKGDDVQRSNAVRAACSRDLIIDLVGRSDLAHQLRGAEARAALHRQRHRLFAQLAAAAGAPTLALFGPSDDRIWRPWGEKVRVVRGARTLEEMQEDRPCAQRPGAAHDRPLRRERDVGGRGAARGDRRPARRARCLRPST